MDVREKQVELPIEDALLVLREEYRQRTDSYTTYLEHGGKGDPAEEVGLDALAMAISALKQQQEQMCATVKKAASAYASGDMKLFNDILCVKTVIIHKPYPFMSNRRFLRYLCETFPTSWRMGWGDPECKTYILSIPTVGQWRSPIDKPTLKK